jgi:hypothetical protein
MNANLQAGTDLVMSTARIIAGEKGRKSLFAKVRLSTDEQRRLNEELLKAQTQEERVKILNNAVNLIRSEAEKSIQEAEIKNIRNRNLLIIGGSITLLIAIILIKKA